VAADLRPVKAYRLPEALRAELARPFGPVLQEADLAAAVAGKTVVAVGDVVSLTLKRLGLAPQAFVCDFSTQRGTRDPLYEHELGSWGVRVVRATNPAGLLTRAAWDAMRAALQGPGPVRVEVEGEEDLLGIPAFLESPIGARVLYGMPRRGVVVVEVTAAFQAQVRELLARFEQVEAP
jgi:uncharacterized protein (UPF0218 family)